LIEHSVLKREEHKNRERDAADRRKRHDLAPDPSQFAPGSRE